MPLDYSRIKNWKFDEVQQAYTEKDVILYALGVGLGQNPLDTTELPFVYEKALKVLPTMASVLAYPGFWMQDPATGIDWVRLVHGEQRTRFHHAFPASGSVRSRTRVTHVIDKGADKGALVITERAIHDVSNGTLLATVEQTTFCRADGGFGQGDAPPPALPRVPERAPDHICSLPTLPQAALLYRLNADRNPLHVDPAVAAKAGYPRPILHGLCTYGIAAHALLKTLCNHDPERLDYLNVRFTAPFYPGETLKVEMWLEDTGHVHFQAKSAERDTVVLGNGTAGIRQ